MGILQPHAKMTMIVFALTCAAILAVQADHDNDHCPMADMTSGMENVQLVNSSLSVDGVIDVAPLCGMQYSVPVNATLYQGMLAASQQQGSNFKFTIGPVHPLYGHFIESINEVSSDDPFYWILFDNTTKMSTPVGVDFIDIVSESAYLWKYVNTSGGHDQNYTGPCGGPSVIAPTMPLMYQVAFLTISNENIIDNDFKPVCKRPILIQPTGTTLVTLFQDANMQLPIYVKAVLDMQMNTLTALNGVANDYNRTWTGYDAGSNVMLPFDLAMTDVEDGDHFVFRFQENSLLDAIDNSLNIGAPSAGQLSILLYAVMAVATLMPSMYI